MSAVTGWYPDLQRKRRIRVAGGALAVVVAAAVIVPIAMSGHHTSASGTAAWSIHPPASFNGIPKLTGSDAKLMTNSAVQVWPLNTPYTAVAYGKIESSLGGSPKASVLIGRVSLSPDRASADIAQEVQLFKSQDPSAVVAPQSPGSYGGSLSCLSVSDTEGGDTVCIFADARTFGFTSVNGPATTSLPAALALRSMSETPPVS